ncbi:MAG: class I SAM-dependent methyltransferase [Terricaulis sp.]
MHDDQASSARANSIADDYDLLPYPSMPYPHTQPQRLAAAAILHGLDPAPPQRARVLELGCAAAGNIIPLAARFPESRFLGVDLARRHIDEAGEQIAVLGLGNIEVRQGDIAQLAFGPDAFDYVICHGVFSWAPPAAQEAILRICGESLTANGVALISYNVLPGWRLRSVIRDICMRHAGVDGAPQERVKRVRAILADITQFSPPGDPYGLLLRSEAKRIARRPGAYILGEFLTPDNAPCYFSDFIERARRHDLAYVCEADFEASVPATIGSAARAKIAEHAGDERDNIEQYVDYFTGRTFRSSVLTRGVGTLHERDYSQLDRLHLAANFRPDPKAGPGAYRDSLRRTLRTETPNLDRLLRQLSEAFPDTVTLAELVDGCAEADQRRIRETLALLVQKGQVELSAIPIRVGRASATFPLLWPVARLEARVGRPWMTSLTHTPTLVQPAVAALATHLDGAHNQAALVAAFADALRRGLVKAPELEGNPAAAGIEQAAEDYVRRVLAYLEQRAMLQPATW